VAGELVGCGVWLGLELHHVKHINLEATLKMQPINSFWSEPNPNQDRLSDSSQRPAYKDPLLIGIFIATFALYLVSMPKTVALEDDSIFILSGFFNGVSHPPGYPLYTVILNLFSKIPIGDIPARSHASSAFFAALSCCVLFSIFNLVNLKREFSALVVIAFSLSATFWSQSIIAEVYTLNAFLNLCMLFYALKINFGSNQLANEASHQSKNFFLFFIFLGLAGANHWPLTVLAAPGYILLIAKPFIGLENKVKVVLPGVFIVFISYLYLYFNSQSSPVISFSGKINGFKELIDFILRSYYVSVDNSSTAGWQDKLQFARDLIIQIIRELNVLLLFSALGFYRLLKSPGFRLIGLAILWIFLSNSLLLLLLLNFDYEYFYTVTFKVYTIVSISVLFVVAGIGMSIESSRADTTIKPTHITVFLLICLVLNAYSSLPENYRHNYSWGEEYAQKTLSETPENSTVFSDGETELGLLSYYHLIKGQRPDIEHYSFTALILGNRLFDYRLKDKKAFIEKYVADNPEDNFYVTSNPYRLNIVTRTIFIDKLGIPGTDLKQSFTNTDIDLILKWSESADASDPWTRMTIAQLRQRAIAILALQLKLGVEEGVENYISSVIEKMIQSEGDLLHYLLALVNNELQMNTDYYRQNLDNIRKGDLQSKLDGSHYSYLSMLADQAQITPQNISDARRKSCLNWPSIKNNYCQPE
jgi:hypothetical protein